MPKIPESIGPFKILQSLGRGGTSQVYKALHPNLKKEVVLKKLTLKGSGPVRERFQREADLMMGFNHGNIVKVYDIFKEGSSWIIVQEYVDGPNLEEVINQKGGLGKVDSLKIIVQCLNALAYIHKSGVVHRDIKPSNIFLNSLGVVKLGDFGIASRLLEGGKGLTREGAALGTPDFMAPEQALYPSSVDGRADIYSLALTWYEAWTGEPYPRKGLSSPAVRFSLAGQILEKGARKNRFFRYSSARSMLIQIRIFLLPLILFGKKGRDQIKSNKKIPLGRFLLLLLIPLLSWAVPWLYYDLLKNDIYGRISFSVPYEPDTASWYVGEVKAKLYHYEEGTLVKDRNLWLFNRQRDSRLISRRIPLKSGNYSFRLTLPDREEWYGFFLSAEGKEIVWDILDHPAVPLTLQTDIYDLLTGHTLSKAELQLITGDQAIPLTGPLPILPGMSTHLLIRCPGYRDLIQIVEPLPRQNELVVRAGLLPLPAKVILKYGFAPENPGWSVPVKINGLSQYLSWEETPKWVRPVLEGTELILLLPPGEHELEIFYPQTTQESTKKLSQKILLNLGGGKVKTIYVE